MTDRSAAARVADCTATLGLHSSSSTTSSYSYFAAASALRSRTARSAELRPPSPFAATPLVSGPMKATLTLSLAPAGKGALASTAAIASADTAILLVMSLLSDTLLRLMHACAEYGCTSLPSPGNESRACDE